MHAFLDGLHAPSLDLWCSGSPVFPFDPRAHLFAGGLGHLGGIIPEMPVPVRIHAARSGRTHSLASGGCFSFFKIRLSWVHVTCRGSSISIPSGLPLRSKSTITAGSISRW